MLDLITALYVTSRLRRSFIVIKKIRKIIQRLKENEMERVGPPASPVKNSGYDEDAMCVKRYFIVPIARRERKRRDRKSVEFHDTERKDLRIAVNLAVGSQLSRKKERE